MREMFEPLTHYHPLIHYSLPRVLLDISVNACIRKNITSHFRTISCFFTLLEFRKKCCCTCITIFVIQGTLAISGTKRSLPGKKLWRPLKWPPGVAVSRRRLQLYGCYRVADIKLLWCVPANYRRIGSSVSRKRLSLTLTAKQVAARTGLR